VRAAGRCAAPDQEGGGFAAAVFPVRRKEAASPPLFSRCAAQCTGPLLRPPGCCASRCARQPCGLPWTPETSAAPWGRKSGQASSLPRHARGAPPGARAERECRTPGNVSELAFDNQKDAENYTNPL